MNALKERQDAILWEQLEQQADNAERLESQIDALASKLMISFKDVDAEIIAIINLRLGGNVNGEIYNKFIVDICYSRAKEELGGKNGYSI